MTFSHLKTWRIIDENLLAKEKEEKALTRSLWKDLRKRQML